MDCPPDVWTIQDWYCPGNSQSSTCLEDMINSWVCAEEPCPDPMEVPNEWFVCPSDAQWCLDDMFDMFMEGDHECFEGDTMCGMYTETGEWTEYLFCDYDDTSCGFYNEFNSWVSYDMSANMACQVGDTSCGYFDDMDGKWYMIETYDGSDGPPTGPGGDEEMS